MAVVKTASPTAAPGAPTLDAGPGRAVLEVERRRRSCRHPAAARCAICAAGERQQAATLHLAAEEGAVAAARAEVGLAHRRSARAGPRARGRPRLRPRCAARQPEGARRARRHALDDQLERRRRRARPGRARAPGRRSRARSRRSGAAGNGTSFSAGWCGAWSVAMQSIVPSRRPSISAWRCGSAASGGLILKRAASSDEHFLVGQQQVVRRGLGGDVDAPARARAAPPRPTARRAGGRCAAAGSRTARCAGRGRSSSTRRSAG